MVVLPNTLDGLHALMEDLSLNTIHETIPQLKGKFIDITIPSFGFKSYSKNLMQNEANSILNSNKWTPFIKFQASNADFSGITTEQKLFVGKLEQFNEIKFFDDEDSNSENSENVTTARNTRPEESIVVDRPFLFFLRDVEDGVIIMAGKIEEFPLHDGELLLREFLFLNRGFVRA